MIQKHNHCKVFESFSRHFNSPVGKKDAQRGRTMAATSRRGFFPEDEKDFAASQLEKLKTAAADFLYLSDRGYSPQGAAALVGDRYQLSARQRTAVVRTVSPRDALVSRLAKQLGDASGLPGSGVHVDGFNAVIALEVALSGSPVFECMDGTVRDLAGLRGTYRIIDKTTEAVRLILGGIRQLGAAKASFYLDAPVSNSGRLKTLINETAREIGFSATAETVNGVDRLLSALPGVITADSAILDRCESWLNPGAGLVQAIPGVWMIDICPVPY